MPMQSISAGPATTLTQNVVYALPAQLVNITTSAACDVSVDQSTWTAFTSGSSTSASFIRSTGVNTVVTVKSATIGGSGGGSNPVVGDDLTLSGSSPSYILIDPTQAANQRRWRINTLAGTYLNFDSENDDGSLIARNYMNRNTGAFVSNAAIQAQVMTVGRDLELSEIPFVSLATALTPGTLANISDSTVNTIGATVAGGGTNHVLARFNGTVWKVIGL